MKLKGEDSIPKRGIFVLSVPDSEGSGAGFSQVLPPTVHAGVVGECEAYCPGSQLRKNVRLYRRSSAQYFPRLMSTSFALYLRQFSLNITYPLPLTHRFLLLLALRTYSTSTSFSTLGLETPGLTLKKLLKHWWRKVAWALFDHVDEPMEV